MSHILKIWLSIEKEPLILLQVRNQRSRDTFKGRAEAYQPEFLYGNFALLRKKKLNFIPSN